MRRKWRYVAVAACMGLIAAACGGDDDDAGAEGTDLAPAGTEAEGTEAPAATEPAATEAPETEETEAPTEQTEAEEDQTRRLTPLRTQPSSTLNMPRTLVSKAVRGYSWHCSSHRAAN